MSFSYEAVVSAVDDYQVPPSAPDIRLGLVDRDQRLGVGRSGSGSYVFVGPQQPTVSALHGSRFEFKPATDLSPLGAEEPLDDVCILRFTPVDPWEGLQSAVSAVFMGLANTGCVSPQDLGPAIHALQGLFEADLRSRVSREVEVGLAGELLAIALANDRLSMAERWHSTVDATFDFSATGERLDIKTTAGHERVHWVSSSQVRAIPGVCTSFLSMVLPVVESGATVRDIFEMLSDLPIPTIARIRSVILETTGEPPETLANLQFDLAAARAGMRHVAAQTVPTPLAMPGVRRMEWEAEFPESPYEPWECGFATLLEN